MERNLRRLHYIQADTGLHSSVANTHHFDPDPDPACHFHADPDPACHFAADPDPTYKLDADPDVSYQIIRIRNIAAKHIASVHRQSILIYLALRNVNPTNQLTLDCLF